MFKQRLLTTLVLVPLVLAAIYYASARVFTGAVLLLVVGCAVEWLQLIPVKQRLVKVIFLIVLGVACYFIPVIFPYWLGLGIVVWISILLFVLRYPYSVAFWGYPAVVGFFCLVLLPLFMQSMTALFFLEKGRGLIVYTLFLVWAADTGAYLVGKQWGNTKLISSVSPGKTIEGALGGFVLSMLVAVVGFFCFKPHSLINWFLIAMVATWVSLLGDLFISMLKRRVKIKDTGHLIPGHGGVLDRLDSLIAAVPFIYAGLLFLPPGL